MRRLHPKRRLGETPWSRATAETVGLHRLLDQPDLFLGSVAPAALTADDDFSALDGLRHRRTPRLPPGPSRLRRLSGRIGGRSTPALPTGDDFDAFAKKTPGLRDISTPARRGALGWAIIVGAERKRLAPGEAPMLASLNQISSASGKPLRGSRSP
jgi:hypothetical protein